MFCSKCGNKVEDGAKFCNNCGANLAEDLSPENASFIQAEVLSEPQEPVMVLEAEPVPEQPQAVAEPIMMQETYQAEAEPIPVMPEQPQAVAEPIPMQKQPQAAESIPMQEQAQMRPQGQPGMQQMPPQGQPQMRPQGQPNMQQMPPQGQPQMRPQGQPNMQQMPPQGQPQMRPQGQPGMQQMPPQGQPQMRPQGQPGMQQMPPQGQPQMRPQGQPGMQQMPPQGQPQMRPQGQPGMQQMPPQGQPQMRPQGQPGMQQMPPQGQPQMRPQGQPGMQQMPPQGQPQMGPQGQPGMQQMPPQGQPQMGPQGQFQAQPQEQYPVMVPVPYQEQPEGQPQEGKKGKQPKPEKAAGKPKKAHPVRIIANILLGLILTLLIIAEILQVSVKEKLTDDYISSIVEKITVDDITNIKIGDEGTSLFEFVEDYYPSITEDTELDEEKLEKLLKSEVVKDFVGEFLDDYLKYLVGGEKPDAINKDTVIKFVEKNKKKLYKDENLKDIIKEGQLDNFAEDYGEEIDRMFSEINEGEGEEISADWLKENVEFDISLVHKLLDLFKWLIPGCIAIFVILLLLVNLDRITRGVSATGYSTAIAGLITGVGAFILMQMYKAEDGDLIGIATNPIAKLVLILGSIVFGAGIIVIIISAIIKKLSYRRKV